MTYSAVNAVFLVIAVAAWAVAVRRHPPGERPHLRAAGGALAVLLVLTAVFDNLMISVGLVDYDPALRLGWSVGVAPVEDFAYPVAGVLLLPALWHLLGRGAPASTGRERPSGREGDR